MNTEDQDTSFALASGWGYMLADARLDQMGEYPKWLPEVFFAMAEAVEKIPAEYREDVIAAALGKWNASETAQPK